MLRTPKSCEAKLAPGQKREHVLVDRRNHCHDLEDGNRANSIQHTNSNTAVQERDLRSSLVLFCISPKHSPGYRNSAIGVKLSTQPIL